MKLDPLALQAGHGDPTLKFPLLEDVKIWPKGVSGLGHNFV